MKSESFFDLVSDYLTDVENQMRMGSDDYHPDLHAALEHLISSGGKRIRPVLTLLTGKMLGGDDLRLITLSSAIEMLHTATLVHDDLIDGSLLRRGIPTINSEWSPAATVLAGDFVFARAAEFAANTESIPVMQLFSRTLATIVNGEITQLFTSKGLSSREDYSNRIYAKTASMFVLATESAAIIANQSKSVQESVRDYGYNTGMAFQIVDDILDFTGKQATVGKPVANDLRQGLITLPAIYYYEGHPEDQDMLAVVNGEYHNNQRMDRLISSIRSSDSINLAVMEARSYVDKAIAALDDIPSSTYRGALINLANYVVSRKI